MRGEAQLDDGADDGRLDVFKRVPRRLVQSIARARRARDRDVARELRLRLVSERRDRSDGLLLARFDRGRTREQRAVRARAAGALAVVVDEEELAKYRLVRAQRGVVVVAIEIVVVDLRNAARAARVASRLRADAVAHVAPPSRARRRRGRDEPSIEPSIAHVQRRLQRARVERERVVHLRRESFREL